jgi:hypothetical protein
MAMNGQPEDVVPRNATTPLDPAMQELVNAVKAHAYANYENDGWDYIVETFTDAELAKEIGSVKSVDAAIAEVGKTTRLLDERRRDIESTAW